MAEAPNPHERAPEAIRSLYKQWQRMPEAGMCAAIDAHDWNGDWNDLSPEPELKDASCMLPSNVQEVFEVFMGDSLHEKPQLQAFEVRSVPGEHVTKSPATPLSESRR
jgi:hypothetical protein